MWKKTFFVLVGIMLLVSGFTCTFAYHAKVEPLVTPMDSLYGVRLGDNLETVRKKLQNSAYNEEWDAYLKETKVANEFMQEYEMVPKNPATSLEVRRTFTIGADLDGRINSISYVLYYRTPQGEYEQLVRDFVQVATANFGTPVEQETAMGKKRLLHRTWLNGEQRLSMVAYDMPGYDPKHPYILRILRGLN